MDEITDDTLNLNAPNKRKVDAMMNETHSEEFGFNKSVDNSENVSRSTQ